MSNSQSSNESQSDEATVSDRLVRDGDFVNRVKVIRKKSGEQVVVSSAVSKAEVEGFRAQASRALRTPHKLSASSHKKPLKTYVVPSSINVIEKDWYANLIRVVEGLEQATNNRARTAISDRQLAEIQVATVLRKLVEKANKSLDHLAKTPQLGNNKQHEEPSQSDLLDTLNSTQEKQLSPTVRRLAEDVVREFGTKLAEESYEKKSLSWIQKPKARK